MQEPEKIHVWADALSKEVWSATTFCDEGSQTYDEGEDLPWEPIPEGWPDLATFLADGRTCGKCCYVLVGELGLPEDRPIEFLRGNSPDEGDD